MSESISTFGRTTMFFNQRQQLRTALKNFFMNPFEKYTSRGRVPWKLIFHILKLAVLTCVLVLFGQDKFQLRLVLNAYKSNLGSLLIKNYQVDTADRDSAAMPVIHRHYEIADFAAHSLVSYFNLTSSAVGIFGFHVDADNKTVLPQLCLREFANAKVDVSEWRFEFDEESTVTCTPIDCCNMTRSQCREQVYKLLPKSYDGFQSLNITFQIRSIFLSLKAIPKCVLLFARYGLTNMVMSGGVISEFELEYDEMECNISSVYKPTDSMIGLREQLGLISLDCGAMVLSIITCFLVLKRLRTTFRLFMQTRNFYHFHYNRSLTWSETAAFVNGWDFFSIFADSMILIGIIFKILLDTGADKHLDICAVLLGSAVGINWILALRFLSFDKGYYILVLTLSVATPNILRLGLCISAIYLGYVLCGWIVFAPYSYKFASISQTVDTLFAIVNGDEILDTFMQIEGYGPLLHYFSKMYFYTFIVLFIYVVLSVMISFIGDAMVVAQSSVQTGIGPWLIGVDVFQELSLGWECPECPEGKEKGPPQPSGQSLNNTPNRL